MTSLKALHIVPPFCAHTKRKAAIPPQFSP